MKKHIFLAVALATATVFAQDGPPPPPGNEAPGQHRERRGPRPNRINPEAMGMLLVARDLVMEKYDTDKDGKLSDAEREVIKTDMDAKKKELEKKYDTNSDGKLSKEEIMAIRDAWQKQNPGLEDKLKELAKGLMPRRDGQEGKDRERPKRESAGKPGERPDGPRNRANNTHGPGPQGGPLAILGARGAHGDKVVMAAVILVVDKYDKDGDGILSTEEFQALTEDSKQAMEKRHEEMKKRHEEMLQKYDKDGDGKLSREERQAMREDWEKSRTQQKN